MQEISAELRVSARSVFTFSGGDYALHPVLPGTEGAEDAFLPGRPCAIWYEEIYAAKKAIIEADDRCEAELERISRGYEAIAEYIGKRMFEQGVYAAGGWQSANPEPAA